MSENEGVISSPSPRTRLRSFPFPAISGSGSFTISGGNSFRVHVRLSSHSPSRIRNVRLKK